MTSLDDALGFSNLAYLVKERRRKRFEGEEKRDFFIQYYHSYYGFIDLAVAIYRGQKYTMVRSVAQ